MVNPGSHSALPKSLEELALAATDIDFVITSATLPGYPIVWVNGAFTRTTGYAFEEAVGRNPRFLQGPDTGSAAVRRIAAALTEHTSGTSIVLNYRKDGTKFWNQVSVSPMFDDEGELAYYVAVQVDVTTQIDALADRERDVDVERRAKMGLQVLSELSDVLNDLDDPDMMQKTSALVARSIGGWCFFVRDTARGLRLMERTSDSSRRTRVPSVIAHSQLHSGAGISSSDDDVSDDAAIAATWSSRSAVPESADLRADDPIAWLLRQLDHGPMPLPISGPVPPPPSALPSPSTPQSESAASRISPSASVSLTEQMVDLITGQVGVSRAETDTVTVAPVYGRKDVIALMVMGSGSSQDPAPAVDVADLEMAQLIARRVGMAADNARLYAREHRMAETLQTAMLPEHVDVQGLDVWTYYAPNSEHAQVGGDWYDILQLHEGPAVFVIGDVAGHDIEAAATMGQLRSVARSSAFELTSPGSVMERVDQIVEGMALKRSASLVYTTFAFEDGTWTLQWSNAGHLPPVLIRAGKAQALREGSGMLIGFGLHDRDTATLALEPGDSIVLYTDGLIERRSRPLKTGLEQLIELSGKASAHDAAGIGEELLTALADDAEDDIAVVVIRVPDPDGDRRPSADTPRQRRWQLPADPSSIARARHSVQRTCAEWEIEDATSAELVVSELVANSVLHGWGRIGLRLFDVEGRLRIEVEDGNPAPPAPAEGSTARVGGYGLYIIDRLAEWGWRHARDGKIVWALMRESVA